MDCKKIKNSLFFLAEGSLKKDEQAEIRNHLSTCPECMKQYELFSDFEKIVQEEKNISPDEYFYSRLISRMEHISSVPEKLKLQPAYVRFVNILIIVFIIGIAAFSGITLANRNYQYLGSSQTNNQQASSQQNDISFDQDQSTNNLTDY